MHGATRGTAGRRPPGLDLLLAAIFCVLVAVEIQLDLTWAKAGWLLPAMAALAWRRVWPEAVAAVVLLTVAMADVDGQTSGTLATALATYTLGAWLPARRAALTLAVVGGAAFVTTLVRVGQVSPSDVGALLIFWVGPLLVGMAQRDAAEKSARARLRAALAEEQRTRQTQEAVERERARIARELHDVVSHSLAVVSINAQAVRRALPAGMSRESEALVAIEATARDAGTEMRRLLGVLRSSDDDDSLAPQPGLSELPHLVERLGRAGIDVRLEVTVDHVSSGLGVTVYRIVQEALTNVVRHAQASRAWVRVCGDGADLVVEVEDDGSAEVQPAGTGHGLVGIRERAHVYGGSADFGTGDHGFLVRVRMPMVRASA